MFARARSRWHDRLRWLLQAARLAEPLPALLALTLAVRIPGLFRPLLGNFATKNVIYAMIARNWATGASPFWHPALDCLKGDRLALHLLEVPLSAYLAGTCWRLAGGSLDVWGRLISIAFSLGTVVLLYRLCLRWHGRQAAAASAALFALSPVSIVCGQAFMLEASLVFFAVGSVWSLDNWLRAAGRRWLWIAAGAFGCALMTKIYMAALIVPLAALVFSRQDYQNLTLRRFLVVSALFACAAVPAITWYVHAANISAPESPLADRIFYSVRDSAAAHRPPHPLLSQLRFYTHTGGDLATVVLTPVGLALATLGLARRDCRRAGPWLVAAGLTLLLLPRKFFELNYYYVPWLPPLCILGGLGWQTVACRLRQRPRWLLAIALMGLACSLRYAARPAFRTPAEDRSVLPAAAAIDQVAGEDDRVVTMHGSTLDLLYYCGRRGWLVSEGERHLACRLRQLAREGAAYFVVAETGPTTLPAVADALDGTPPYRRGRGYVIYRLEAPIMAAESTGARRFRE